MTIEFKVAAEAATPGEKEPVVEVPIDGEIFIARKPTTAQIAILNVALSSRNLAEQFVGVIDMVEAMMGASGRTKIEELLRQRRIDMDDLVGGSESNEAGLLDQIVAEFSGRPTKPSTGSSSKSQPSGRRSTGRAPGKGSTTRSPSPSEDS